MAQSKTARPVKTAEAHHPATAQDKIALAMKAAADQAKKQLAAQGLKLPTQNWASTTIRNPAT